MPRSFTYQTKHKQQTAVNKKVMESKLAEAIRKALSENGITLSDGNPVEVHLCTANGDMNTRVMFPAVKEGKSLQSIRATEITTLGLATSSCNALHGNGVKTVGDALDRVAEGGCYALMRRGGFAMKGFFNLRAELWHIGVALTSDWKVLDYNGRDLEWERRFPK